MSSCVGVRKKLITITTDVGSKTHAISIHRRIENIPQATTSVIWPLSILLILNNNRNTITANVVIYYISRKLCTSYHWLFYARMFIDFAILTVWNYIAEFCPILYTYFLTCNCIMWRTTGSMCVGLSIRSLSILLQYIPIKNFSWLTWETTLSSIVVINVLLNFIQ